MRARLIAIFLVLVGCFFVVRAAPAAQALAVSPVLFDFEIAPGVSKQGTITIINDTETEDVFRLEVQNFVAEGEEGAQTYLDEQRPSDLASWVFVSKPTVTLGPGQSAEFPFVVNVPADAEPGGHYASVFFDRAPRSANGTGVGIGGKVGVLLLVNVPGNVREDAQIESFTLRGPAIRSALPAYFDLRIRNLGSVHFRPRGSLVIKNVFGRTVQRASANPKNAAVLPNSVRRVESVWAQSLVEEPETGFIGGLKNEWKNFAIGRYKAFVEISYGSQAHELTSTELSFWVIPWRLLTLVIVALIILIALIKMYNRLLVRSALRKESRRR